MSLFSSDFIISRLLETGIKYDQAGVERMKMHLDAIHRLASQAPPEQIKNLYSEVRRPFKVVDPSWDIVTKFEANFLFCTMGAMKHYCREMTLKGLIEFKKEINLDIYLEPSIYQLGGRLTPDRTDEERKNTILRVRREQREAFQRAQLEAQEKAEKIRFQTLREELEKKAKKTEKRRRQREKRIISDIQ